MWKRAAPVDPAVVGKAYDVVPTAEDSAGARDPSERHGEGIPAWKAVPLLIILAILLALLYAAGIRPPSRTSRGPAGGATAAIRAKPGQLNTSAPPDKAAEAAESAGGAAPQDTYSRGPPPAGPEAEACRRPLPESDRTSEDEPEPPVGSAAPGQRVRMPAFGDVHKMEYQLFLPSNWVDDPNASYPVVVFLHGAGDGKFSVMNSQSLPRLLTKDQSVSFDSRACWCLDARFERVATMREAPADSPDAFLEEVEELRSPLADCDFAETFEAIAVMPQGWLPTEVAGWAPGLLRRVEGLTRSVLRRYHGDPERVALTGQSAGGAGAWAFAGSRPELWAAVNPICMPPFGNLERLAGRLEGKPVWVAGWTGDGEAGNDKIVSVLKERREGSVRYTRYTEAPAPPDPQYRGMLNHASYDLIYRDPRLWRWLFAQENLGGRDAWGF